MCTYNGASFLHQQLKSIVEQTIHANEIIICDDGSTDSTVDIIKQFQQYYPGLIQYYSNEINLGSTKNFEHAIAKTSGDFIFFSDQDDIWLDDKIENFVEAFNKDEKILALFSDGILVDEKGDDMGITLWDAVGFNTIVNKVTSEKHALFDYILLFDNIITGSAMAIRKEAKQFIFPFRFNEEIKWHDEWISLVLGVADKVKPLSKITYKHRQHQTQHAGIALNGSNSYWIQQRPLQRMWADFNPSQYPATFISTLDKQIKKYVKLKPYLMPHQSLEEHYNNNLHQFKKNIFKQTPWVNKKLRLLKWWIEKRYNTSFKEVVTF